RAQVITTVSEFVKTQITEYFGTEPERVQVAPDAVDPIFSAKRADQTEPLLCRLGIRAPYVVAMGGAPRRALPVAIEAWRQASQGLDRDVTLVVVGDRSPAAEPGVI